MSSLLLLLVIPLVSSFYIPYQGHPSLPTYSYSYPAYQPFQSYPIYQSKHVSKPILRTIPLPFKQALLNTPTRSLIRSDNIIQNTRTQAESLKTDLRSMARNPRAAQILNRVFADKNNVCINSMDDAIETIEMSTKLVENAGSEIKELVEIIKVFEKSIDTPKAVRETANILRLLDTLIPKITPATSTCGTSSADVFGSLQSLGVLVDELATKDDIYFSIQKKQSLKS